MAAPKVRMRLFQAAAKKVVPFGVLPIAPPAVVGGRPASRAALTSVGICEPPKRKALMGLRLVYVHRHEAAAALRSLVIESFRFETALAPWPTVDHTVRLAFVDPAVFTDAKNVTTRKVVAENVPAVSHRAGEAALNGLMDRYAGGDDSVFRELHGHLAPRVNRFLLRLTGSAALAEELAQEVFLRMHRARGAFSRGGVALPWVYTVTRNVFLDHERKRKVHSAVVHDDDLAQAQRDAVSRRPDQVLDSRRTLDLVRGALARMPVSQREAFVLLRFEGLSVSDAAEVLGTTEASVKSRAFRAYEAIRLATKDDANQGEE